MSEVEKLLGDVAAELAQIIADKLRERMGRHMGFTLFAIQPGIGGALVRIGNMHPADERAVIADWLATPSKEFTAQHEPVDGLVPS